MLVKSSRWEEKQKHGLCGETMMKHIFFFYIEVEVGATVTHRLKSFYFVFLPELVRL